MEQKASSFPGGTKGESWEVLGKMTKKMNGTQAAWGLRSSAYPWAGRAWCLTQKIQVLGSRGDKVKAG